MDRLTYDFRPDATEAIVIALQENPCVAEHFRAIINGHPASLGVVREHLTFLLTNWSEGLGCKPGIVHNLFLQRVAMLMLLAAQVYTDWRSVTMLVRDPMGEYPRNDLAAFAADLVRNTGLSLPRVEDFSEKEHVFAAHAIVRNQEWLRNASLRAMQEPVCAYGQKVIRRYLSEVDWEAVITSLSNG